MPGTEKVLGSALTRTCFFFQTGYILFQIKLSANYLSAYLGRLSCHILKTHFFLLRAFVFDVAFRFDLLLKVIILLDLTSYSLLRFFLLSVIVLAYFLSVQ